MATVYSGIQPIYKTGAQAPAATAYAPTKYSESYGGIPTLPAYSTDTTQTIGTDVPTQLAANLPLYTQMAGKGSEDILAHLSGELAPDVIQQLSQRAAERGIAGGAPGSANVNASLMRALGLTSQQLQQLGQQELTAAIQRTPIQQTQIGTQTQDLAPQQAVYAAAPAPASAAGAALAAARQGMAAGAGGVQMPVAPKMPQMQPTASQMAGYSPSAQGTYGSLQGMGLTYDPISGNIVSDPNAVSYNDWLKGTYGTNALNFQPNVGQGFYAYGDLGDINSAYQRQADQQAAADQVYQDMLAYETPESFMEAYGPYD